MENNVNKPVEIDVQVLTKQVNDGMKKAELAAHYGLPMAQMTRVLQQTGLKIRKFGHARFVLVDNTNKAETTTTETAEDVVEETVEEQPVVDNAPEEDIVNKEVQWGE